LNADGNTDVLDFAVLLVAFGTSAEEPGFDPAPDLEADGVINVLDFAEFVSDFGCGS
jgi:hypothetical protein